MPATPRSHPLMTCPPPRRNWKGCPRSTELSNFVPSRSQPGVVNRDGLSGFGKCALSDGDVLDNEVRRYSDVVARHCQFSYFDGRRDGEARRVRRDVVVGDLDAEAVHRKCVDDLDRRQHSLAASHPSQHLRGCARDSNREHSRFIRAAQRHHDRLRAGTR